jgi:hypothetical protein
MTWKNFFHIDMRNPFMQLFVGVGLLQGILYYFLVDRGLLDFGSRLETIDYLSWRQVTAWFLFQAGFAFFLTYNPSHARRSAIVSVIFGLLQAGLWVLFFSTFDAKDGFILGTEYALSLILCYVAMPFLQIYTVSGRRSFPYEELFRHAWNNIQITLTSYILAILFFGVLFLCCGLLKVLKFTLFWDAITEDWFWLPAAFTVKAIGYAMARDNETIVAALRKTSLAFYRFLSPILAIFAVLFGLALLGGGLQAVWEARIATLLFVSFIVMSILFFNAVFQDGAQDIYFGGFLGAVQRAGLILLPLFAGLAVYSLMIRINQYGLTPLRFYGILTTGIAGLYAVIYALAALIPAGRAAWLIKRGNVGMAFVILAVCMLIQVPPLSPANLSATHQMHLLVSGRIAPEKFDFPALQFNMGKPGREALNRLTAAGGPNAALVQEKIHAARTMSRYGRPSRPKATDAELRDFSSYMLVKVEGGVPDALAEILLTKETRPLIDECKRRQTCALIDADIDRDGKKEILFIIQMGSVNVYVPTATGWEKSSYYGMVVLPQKENKTWKFHQKIKSLPDILPFFSVIKPKPVPAVDDIELGEGAWIRINRR